MFKQKRIIEKTICFIKVILNFHIPAFRSVFIFLLLFVNLLTEANAVPGYKKKIVFFGGDSSSPPYEYLNENNIPQGYCVELTKAIAEEIGWDARIVLGKWADIRKDLETGKINIIEKAVYSDERSKIYNYSMPYHEFRCFVFINTADLHSYELYKHEGMNAIVQKNSFPLEYIKRNYPQTIIKEKDRVIDILSHLSAERNSYTLLNKYSGLYLIRTYEIQNVTPAGEPVLIERYHYISLKKNQELLAGINEGLNILKVNGKLKKINDKWFGIIEDKNDYATIKTILIIIFIIVLMSLIWFISSLKKKIKIQCAVLSQDIDKHLFSANALMESEERSKLIIENAPIGIFHFDLNGIITTCNDSFINIMGSTKDKVIGFNIFQYQDKKMPELVKSAIDGNPGYYEGECSNAEKPIQIRAMYTPIKLSDGTITGGLGIYEDITARKKYEESLVAAKNTAESASSIKSHFLANMSHEVRTPLNGILGMLQLLQTTGINEEQANYVSIAIKSGMRLARLLNDILELSRVEADKLVLNETQFSLKNIFNFIEERYITECDEKGVKLILNINENTPDEIVGDEIRIRQILINLVSNSVKYTKTGNISVNIHAEDISLYGAVNIIISVRDTGIGIAGDMLNQIFEPFKQGENLYKRTFQGAGLGLTLVKHLVNIMNGTIKIDSTPGKGTSIECSVTVKLPENHAFDIKPVSSEKLNKSGKLITILIAEDERINRLALKRILEKLGYRILEAETGIEVLKILETENPDCILMDIQMPEMDGIETTRMIRDREKYGDKSSTPVIALTAYTLPEDREKIKAAGLDDFISKPVNMDYLVKSISKFVIPAQTELQ